MSDAPRLTGADIGVVDCLGGDQGLWPCDGGRLAWLLLLCRVLAVGSIMQLLFAMHAVGAFWAHSAALLCMTTTWSLVAFLIGPMCVFVDALRGSKKLGHCYCQAN